MTFSSQGGLNWLEVARNQHYSILRRGGLMNLAAAWYFFPLWGGACVLTQMLWGGGWLLLPANLSFVFALGLYRRYRLITDTPTSLLNSAAQGYVELQGVARLPDGEAYRGLPHLPVTVWLPGYVEDAPFVLEDSQGRCLLYPDQAEVVTRRADTHLYWLHAIYPGQTLYALGELRTYGGDNQTFDRRSRLMQLLAEWKRTPHLLLQHFDANDNGQIDPDEWEAVRNAAQRRVDEDIHEQRTLPGTHVMDGAGPVQLFLITNIPPQQLAIRYLHAAWLHGAIWACLLAWVSTLPY